MKNSQSSYRSPSDRSHRIMKMRGEGGITLSARCLLGPSSRRECAMCQVRLLPNVVGFASNRMKVGDFTATKKFIPVKSHIRGKRLGSRTAKGLRFRRALSHHFPQSDNVLRRRLDVRLQVVWKAATHLFTHSPIPGFFLAAVGAMAQAATTLEVFAAHAAHI